MFTISKKTTTQIENAVGLSLSQISAMNVIDEIKFVESKNNTPLVFSKNRFPVLTGRGNPLLTRKRIKTINDLEQQSKELFGI